MVPPQMENSAMTDFGRLEREPSLAHRVTSKVLNVIINGGLNPGDPLASERDLSEQFGVSRTVIREAVRSLEARGLIQVRSGRPAVVAAVPESVLTETIQLWVRGAQSQDLLGPAEIAEVRTTLELRVVELATERATKEEISALEDSVTALREATDAETAAVHDETFHLLIARATHNRLYITLLESLHPIMAPIRRSSLGVRGRQAEAARQHSRIVKAMASKDAAAARAAMDAHLADSRRFYGEEGSE